MKSAAVYMSERRARARNAGLCIVCCKQRPPQNLSTCKSCSSSATRRTTQRRAIARKRSELQHLIEAHEHRGDASREHHLYDEAASHYQHALDIQAIAVSDRFRISEKLVYALALGSDPGAANRWLHHALPNYLRHLGRTPKAVEFLLQRARHLWADSNVEAVFPLMQKAIEISEELGDRHLRMMSWLSMINYLKIFGRYEECQENLRLIDRIDNNDDLDVTSMYHMVHATAAASSGDAKKAYAHFEAAVAAAEHHEDSYRLTSVWANYGLYAMVLGNIELAKTCVERSLFISRQYQQTWRIPHICSLYVDILFKMGQYDLAHGYLVEALSVEAQSQLIDEALAEAGIPLALYMKDENLLRRCARPRTMDRAFQSKIPASIASVSDVFARFYAAQGARRRAQILLSKAFAAIRGASVPCPWDLPLGIARNGRIADIPEARKILADSPMCLSSAVVQACLSLFDALVAQRRKQFTEAHVRAETAMSQFNALRWFGFADEARSILPAKADVHEPSRLEGRRPFSQLQPVLTTREQQVAELILKGYTNRAIATELSISRYTVDSHVTSIMNRLGIRSRYQLPAAIPKPASPESRKT